MLDCRKEKDARSSTSNCSRSTAADHRWLGARTSRATSTNVPSERGVRLNARERTVHIRAIKDIAPARRSTPTTARSISGILSRSLQVRLLRAQAARERAEARVARRRLRRSCDGRDRQGAEMKTSPAQRTKPKTKAAKATKAKATKAKTPAKARRDARHRAGLMARRIHDRRGLRRDDVLLGLPMVVSFPTATPGAIHPTMSASICGCGGSAAA